jgi:hypothetical protein
MFYIKTVGRVTIATDWSIGRWLKCCLMYSRYIFSKVFGVLKDFWIIILTKGYGVLNTYCYTLLLGSFFSETGLNYLYVYCLS